jgi:hypothetical protein
MRWPLERLQRDFAAALLDGDTAAALAPSLLAGDRAGLRLALYSGNLDATWENTLARAYPVLRALLGAEFFAALARRYGRLHPSRSGDLNDFGGEFASFVSAFEHTQSLPYLADVAALEWRVHRAAFAADATPLRRERLAALSPDELLATRFALHPACAWLRSPFPVASIWLAHQESDVALPDTLDRGECALIVRPQWTAQALLARPGELAALQAIGDGEDIDGAIAAGLRAEPDFDFARLIVRWLDYNVIVEAA